MEEEWRGSEEKGEQDSDQYHWFAACCDHPKHHRGGCWLLFMRSGWPGRGQDENKCQSDW